MAGVDLSELGLSGDLFMFARDLLEGRTVLVTGAGRGIGEEIALTVAELGADVGVNDIDEEAAKATVDAVEERGQNAIAVPGDVSETGLVSQLVDEVETELGVVRHVVNNAAKTSGAPLQELPMREWRRVMRINVDATLEFSRTVAQRLIEKNKDGSIVNISSIAGVRPLPGNGAYTSSKAAIIKLTEQMALEWGEHDIRVNAVCPGLIWTPATDSLYADEEVLEKREQWVPLKRIGTPEDIARGTVFLLAPENTYTTGEALFVDGGAQTVGLNLAPGQAQPE